MKNNIILIGFMGTGKSTVSKKLSFLTGKRDVDLDNYIEKKEGRKITEIFEKDGEEEFRRLETHYLKKVADSKDVIISCGGGTVIKQKNVDIMKENGSVVLLTATPESIYERVKDTNNRPILNGNMNVEYISELMKKREALYMAAADVIISTDNKEVSDICNEILTKI